MCKNFYVCYLYLIFICNCVNLQLRRVQPFKRQNWAGHMAHRFRVLAALPDLGSVPPTQWLTLSACLFWPPGMQTVHKYMQANIHIHQTLQQGAKLKQDPVIFKNLFSKDYISYRTDETEAVLKPGTELFLMLHLRNT